MSITWRTVAPAQALSANSGSTAATIAFASSLPSATSTAAIKPAIDLVAENIRCGVVGFMPLR